MSGDYIKVAFDDVATLNGVFNPEAGEHIRQIWITDQQDDRKIAYYFSLQGGDELQLTSMEQLTPNREPEAEYPFSQEFLDLPDDPKVRENLVNEATAMALNVLGQFDSETTPTFTLDDLKRHH